MQHSRQQLHAEEEVKQALYKYGVIFFRDQELTPETHIEFSKIFGAADKHPIVQGLADYPEVLEIRKVCIYNVVRMDGQMDG